MVRRSISLVVLGLAALALGGCSSSQDSKVRNNLYPELTTLSQRPIEWDNSATLAVDTNLRAMNNDLTRLFLLDRPSRLTREPMPH
jgi:hypothetical protein